MNKAELIRAIAKKVGIPDVNAKFFFEILLKRLSEILQPGQAIDISGNGFLQLRKGKLQTNEQDKSSLNNDINLIVYYERADEPDVDNLIFNIPEIDSQPKDTFEQSFSLSLGKPVIPLKGVKETEYYAPLTGKELKALVSKRVETLLSKLKIVRDYAKGSEVLVITPTKYSRDKFEIKWEDLSGDDTEDEVKTEPDVINDEQKTTKKIEWEFGPELSKQIEEEAILDTEKDEVSLITPKGKIPKKDNVGWNFGVTQVEISKSKEKRLIEKNAKDKIDKEHSTTSITDINSEKDTKELNENNKYETHSVENPEYQKIETLYDRLKAKKGIETEEFDLTWSFGETSQIETAGEIPITKHFPEKSIEKETLGISNVEKSENITEEIIKDKISHKELTEEEIFKDDKVISRSTKPTITKEKVKKKTLEKRAVSKQRQTYPNKGRYSKRGSVIPFFIGLFVIIAVGVILIAVLTDINLDFFNFTKKPAPKSNKIFYANTNIINRNYDIPISVTSEKLAESFVKKGSNQKPVRKNIFTKKKYKSSRKGSISKKTKNQLSPLKTSRIKALRESMNKVINATKDKKLNITPKKENQNNITTTDKFSFENLPAPVDTAKLNSNIFRVGNTYTVQVSSWKSNSKAKSEASKLRAKGYNAFVTKALIPGRGFWYRVRVRNFKSIRKAEDFLLLYQ